MAVSQEKLRELQLRADQADELINQLRRTFEQLKQRQVQVPPPPQQSGSSFTPTQARQIVEKLHEIREQVKNEELQLAEQSQIIRKQRETMKIIKDRVEKDLLQLREDILVGSAASNPQEFRNEIVRELRQIRAEVVELEKKNKLIPPGIQQRLVGELTAIKNDIQNNLEQQQRSEYEDQQFKATLKRKLLTLRDEVDGVESENKSLKKKNQFLQNELDGYRSKDQIPPRMKSILVERLNELKQGVFQIETENKQLRMEVKPNPFDFLLKSKVVTTIDMHVGGEPLRIVESGLPPLQGETILEKRRYLKEHLDDYRRLIMQEPRGHFDMYGAILTEPDVDADFGVVFIHHTGYSTMCGHAIIALGRYAVDFDKVTVDSKATLATVRIQVPCGLVNVKVAVKNGHSTGHVQFESAPAWAEQHSVPIKLGDNTIKVDISYGGTYYAVVRASDLGLSMHSPVDQLIKAGTDVKDAVKSQIKFSHPDSNDIAFVYGTIITDDATNGPSTNATIFADRQVDRSPTGSGVMARIANDVSKKITNVGFKRQFISLTGSTFSGTAVREVDYKGKKAVIVEVSGESHYMGRNTFILEEGDKLGEGFALTHR